jgi:hypothetical protein
VHKKDNSKCPGFFIKRTKNKKFAMSCDTICMIHGMNKETNISQLYQSEAIFLVLETVANVVFPVDISCIIERLLLYPVFLPMVHDSLRPDRVMKR